jgi:hypothetical protein
MTLVPELDQFVRDGYTRLTVIHGVTVWQRRSDAGQSA